MTDDDLKRLFDTMRHENAAAHADTRRHFEVTAEGLRKDTDASVADLHRHFDVVAERLEKRFDTLADSVASVDEKLDRKTADLEERMERGFTETQAMIKFSHAELDRRVRSVEQAVADLQARVERLETTTH